MKNQHNMTPMDMFGSPLSKGDFVAYSYNRNGDLKTDEVTEIKITAKKCKIVVDGYYGFESHKKLIKLRSL